MACGGRELGGGGDLCVNACRAQAEGGVHRIVVGVDEVVGGAGMLADSWRRPPPPPPPPACRWPRPAPRGRCRGGRGRRRLAASRSSGQASEESSAHGLGIGDVAFELLPLSEEDPRPRPGRRFSRSVPGPWPRRVRRRRAPGVSRTARAARLNSSRIHSGMVVGHGLAPGRHGEVGLEHPRAVLEGGRARPRTRSCAAAGHRAESVPEPRPIPTSGNGSCRDRSRRLESPSRRQGIGEEALAEFAWSILSKDVVSPQ